MIRKSFLILSLFTSLLWGDKCRYVVGIHGLAEGPESLYAITRMLRCAGMEVYLWDYPSTAATICFHAEHLVEVLQQIAKERPKEPIDFFCHSVGALVLRKAVNLEGCPEEAKIGRAVLIAPPNKGSRLAREYRWFAPAYICTGRKIGCELSSCGPEAMDALGNFPEKMQVLVIAGCKGSHLYFDEPNDGFVTVNETALNTPYYFQSFRAGHGRLLTYPQAIELTRCFLEQGMPEETKKDESES